MGSARCWLTTGPNSGLTYSTYIYNFINGWVKCSIRWWLISLELLVKSIILHGTLLASRLSDLGSLFDVRPSLLCLFPLSFLSPPKFSRISLISRIASEVDLSSNPLARFITCLRFRVSWCRIMLDVCYKIDIVEIITQTPFCSVASYESFVKLSYKYFSLINYIT